LQPGRFIGRHFALAELLEWSCKGEHNLPVSRSPSAPLGGSPPETKILQNYCPSRIAYALPVKLSH
jgi:hypothetical protein